MFNKIKFNELINSYNNGHGITKLNLENKLNINRVMFSRYSKGDAVPTTENLIKIADFFNVSIDYLLDRTTDSTYANPIFIDIIKDFNKLKQNQQDEFIFIIKKILYYMK